MPSVTVMVVNSRGVPPVSATPFLTDCACRRQRDVAGRGLVPAGGDADEGLVDLVLGQPHRVVVAAMRRAIRAPRSRAATAAATCPSASSTSAPFLPSPLAGEGRVRVDHQDGGLAHPHPGPLPPAGEGAAAIGRHRRDPAMAASSRRLLLELASRSRFSSTTSAGARRTKSALSSLRATFSASLSALARSLPQPGALGVEIDHPGERQHDVASSSTACAAPFGIAPASGPTSIARAIGGSPRSSARARASVSGARVAQQDRRERRGRHVHLRAHRADLADQPHHPVQLRPRRLRRPAPRRARARARGSGCNPAP